MRSLSSLDNHQLQLERGSKRRGRSRSTDQQGTALAIVHKTLVLALPLFRYSRLPTLDVISNFLVSHPRYRYTALSCSSHMHLWDDGTGSFSRRAQQNWERGTYEGSDGKSESSFGKVLWLGRVAPSQVLPSAF